MTHRIAKLPHRIAQWTKLPISQQHQEDQVIADQQKQFNQIEQVPYTQYHPQQQLTQVPNAEPLVAVALVSTIPHQSTKFFGRNTNFNSNIKIVVRI